MWNKSKEKLPGPGIRVMVCYPGDPEVSDGFMEVTRSDYVIEHPEDYPLWHELPEYPDKV